MVNAFRIFLGFFSFMADDDVDWIDWTQLCKCKSFHWSYMQVNKYMNLSRSDAMVKSHRCMPMSMQLPTDDGNVDRWLGESNNKKSHSHAHFANNKINYNWIWFSTHANDRRWQRHMWQRCGFIVIESVAVTAWQWLESRATAIKIMNKWFSMNAPLHACTSHRVAWCPCTSGGVVTHLKSVDVFTSHRECPFILVQQQLPLDINARASHRNANSRLFL